MNNDKFHDECGVFGIWDHPEAARIVYLGLYALQHRGQEAAGIVSSDGEQLHLERGTGYVADVFKEEKLDKVPGSASIGHVRYSTAGESTIENAQPILIATQHGQLALCHNGNLIGVTKKREELQREGATFSSTSDSEIILHLISRSKEKPIENAVAQALRSVAGAYSVLVQMRDRLIAIRDPYGFRPLCLGKLNGSFVFASETCAFDLVNAEYIRDVQPGELIVVDKTGIRSLHPFDRVKPQYCIFEHIYFARPDSRVFGQSTIQSRYKLGRQLARESRLAADVVVPVPDSGVPAAMGFASEANIPFEFGLIRNHYVGRTFIEPKQSIRDFGVKIKLNPVRDILKGRRVILIDDSIVRGTTSRKIVRLVRSVGASEVHMCISSPPIISPCFYGINTPTKEELIASHNPIDHICRFIEADSLAYLSLAGLLNAVHDSDDFCTACFTGRYPTPVNF